MNQNFNHSGHPIIRNLGSDFPVSTVTSSGSGFMTQYGLVQDGIIMPDRLVQQQQQLTPNSFFTPSTNPSIHSDQYLQLPPSRNQDEEIQLLRAQIQKLSIEKNHLLKSTDELLKKQQKNSQLSPTIIINYPNRVPLNRTMHNMFLGGPIHSDNWQKIVIDKLKDTIIGVINPRSDDWKNIKINEQIEWEMEYLEQCNIGVFWFPWDHPNVHTTLMQLGRCTATKDIIFVGVHSNNKHRKMIHEFIRVTFPQIPVSSTLDKLCNHILHWIHTGTICKSTSDSGSVQSASLSFHTNRSDVLNGNGLLNASDGTL